MNPQFNESTLLVVDDEKQNRLLLTELFEGEYKVIQAKNGLQALERARSHAPDLILLDVLMPEMDGMATIRASSSARTPRATSRSFSSPRSTRRPTRSRA
ncbi:MAG: response regulator [Paenacidovorax caeni]